MKKDKICHKTKVFKNTSYGFNFISRTVYMFLVLKDVKYGTSYERNLKENVNRTKKKPLRTTQDYVYHYPSIRSTLILELY